MASTDLDDVVHETVAEHPVELDLLVLENVLQTALGTVLGEDGLVRRLDTHADKPHQVVVMQILHLETHKREHGVMSERHRRER